MMWMLSASSRSRWVSVALSTGGATDSGSGERGAGIDPLALLEDLVVQMWAGRQARRADIGYDLALAHGRPRGDPARPGRQVAIAGLQPGAVADLQPAPVASVPARLLDQAVARRQHRGADRGAEVYALMHTGEA